jgi:hypothetical protein
MKQRRVRRWSGLAFAIAVLLVFMGRADAAGGFSISSPAFGEGAQMPPKYARTHDNVSPPLEISGVPAGAKSLALIVDDPDAPGGLFTHWVVWNIAPDATSMPEGGLPPAVLKAMGGIQMIPREGANSFGDAYYDGPKPPNGKHRYFFHLFALDTTLSLPAGSDRAALEATMKGHIVGRAKFFGTFATGQ